MAEWTKKSVKLQNTSDPNVRGLKEMPLVGLGTWQSKPGEVEKAVEAALRRGYRHIDTATAYGNENEVGAGIKASGVPREEIWITTKLDNQHHKRIAEALDDSLKALGTDYLDLYLMHWPCSTNLETLNAKKDPNRKWQQHYMDWNYKLTWLEMQKLVGTGKVKNIGVSNWGEEHIKKAMAYEGFKIMPAVNQIELHPYHQTAKLVARNAELGIHTTGYSCLGSTGTDLNLAEEPDVKAIAQAHNKTPQQILLIWGLQKGWSLLPKSVTPSRIDSNFELDGVTLSDEEMAKITALEKPGIKVCGCTSWLPKMPAEVYLFREEGDWADCQDTDPTGPENDHLKEVFRGGWNWEADS